MCNVCNRKSMRCGLLWAAVLFPFGDRHAVAQVQTTVEKPAFATADAWPVERGDVRGTGVASSVLPAEPEVIWKKKIADALEGTAAIVDGVIYIADSDSGIHAVRLEDGEKIWSKEFEAGFLSAVGYHDGRVYAGDFSGVLHCLDAKSGDEVWTFEANTEFYAGPNFYEGTVLLACESGSLLCLDAATGEEKWTFAIDAPLRCMPTISQGHIALAGCDALLHVVDASTGEEVTSMEIDSQTGSTPAALDGFVYFGTEGGTFYALPTDKGDDGWYVRDPQRSQAIRSAAAVTDELVIYGSNGKLLTARDRKSGDVRWEFPLRSGMENAPVISGEHVFFASGRGRLYGVSIKTGEEVWQYNAGGDFLASPAVAQGRLVIGNVDGTLYCFGSP